MDTESNYYSNYRPELVRLLPDTSRSVLEIGCGEGRFRSNLPSTCEYYGVELSPAAAVSAVGVLDKVFVGTYNDVAGDLPKQHFDLIVCNDVIEHMPDHDDFLERIKPQMAAGAYIIGSIPNVRYYPHLIQLLVKKDWRYTDHGILDRTHLRFFTSVSWRRTLVEHGYTVEILEGINGIGLGATWPRRLAKRLLLALLGQDTRFLQFAFRAKLRD